MKKQVDYLIVGQGLAGTFLAFQLMQQNKTVFIVDKGHKYSSSRVAAGVINPIVLRRYTITWRAKEFLKYNTSFYKRLDQFLGKQYHFEIPIEKLIASEEEKQFWEKRYQEKEVQEFIEEKLEAVDKAFQPSKDFLVGKVKNTSWVNISGLIHAFRSYLVSKNDLLEEGFDHSFLKSNTYKNINFKNIVFCEGANGKQNPLFSDLPFSLNKGQLVTIYSDFLPENRLLKKKVFTLPVSKKEFKVGATYAWDWNRESEEKAHVLDPEKSELIKEHLEEITRSEYKILKEEVGIRPSIKDRRPLIGQHREYKNIYIFNGMGTRGCFMAPLLAEEFISFSDNGVSLHPETDIKRFY